MASASDDASLTDAVTVTLTATPGEKGPDPDVWGKKHAEAPRVYGATGRLEPDPPGIEVKGPDPKVWGKAHAAAFNKE